MVGNEKKFDIMSIFVAVIFILLFSIFIYLSFSIEKDIEETAKKKGGELDMKTQNLVAVDDKRMIILILTEIKKVIDNFLLALLPDYEMSINKLAVSKRTIDCLNEADIKTIGELVKKTPAQLLKLKNFGPKSLGEIKVVLAEMNLVLAKN